MNNINFEKDLVMTTRSFYYINMNKIIKEALETCDNVIVIDEATAYGTSAGIDPRMTMIATPKIEDTILHYSPKGIGELMRYGTSLRNSLQLGNGYQTEVIDFGDAISVKISYTNTKTSLHSSQNFIVLFTRTSGQCIVKSNSQKWRTCNSIEQAANYIRSKATFLSSKTSGLN